MLRNIEYKHGIPVKKKLDGNGKKIRHRTFIFTHMLMDISGMD